MSTKKVWVIEEVETEGAIAHRQSVASFSEDENDWSWECPTDRLSTEGQVEWDRVMAVLSDVNGEDFRHLLCGVGLMDHCNGIE
jgi:hypothetical protein